MPNDNTTRAHGTDDAAALAFLAELRAELHRPVTALTTLREALTQVAVALSREGRPARLHAIAAHYLTRDEQSAIAAQHVSGATMNTVGTIGPLDVDIWRSLAPDCREDPWPEDKSRLVDARLQFERAAVAIVDELHRRAAARAGAADKAGGAPGATGARCSLPEALTGMPEHGLPPIPSSTLYGWLDDPKTARVLDVDRSAPRRTQRPLIAGLLQLAIARRRPKAKGARAGILRTGPEAGD